MKSSKCTLNQPEEQLYKNYKDYMAYISDRMHKTGVTFYRSIHADMREGGVDLTTPDKTALKHNVENYFWAMGLPFPKITNFTNWFLSELRCPTYEVAI